jgi:nicotinate-nucleotide adenylyltransferase
VRYCIFGGSFDPPHEGHRYLAKSALDSLRLDHLFWVPSPDPPHKAMPGTSFNHRVAMVKLLLGDASRQTCSDVEAALPKPSYSLNTIRALKKQFGEEHEWRFLIGADNWEIFPTWHRWQEVLQEVGMVVFPRQGHDVGTLPQGVERLDLPEMHLQSRWIRETLAATGDMDAAKVPKEIREYIVANRLYGMGVRS